MRRSYWTQSRNKWGIIDETISNLFESAVQLFVLLGQLYSLAFLGHLKHYHYRSKI